MSEVTDFAGMLKAWEDSDGILCGRQLASAGLIDVRFLTEADIKLSGFEQFEPGDAVWELTDAGAALRKAGGNANG